MLFMWILGIQNAESLAYNTQAQGMGVLAWEEGGEELTLFPSVG